MTPDQSCISPNQRYNHLLQTQAVAYHYCETFGALEAGHVFWEQGGKLKKRSFEKGQCLFFYGFPELGKNVVWKPIDTNPSLSLNFYHKAKNFLKASQILTR